LAFSIANLAVLAIRIRAENASLAAMGDFITPVCRMPRSQ
jgi:isoprenylcysteine carboxyl methyltransferase (ICMT) family protein YpbQ